MDTNPEFRIVNSVLTLDVSAYHGYWQEDMYRVNPFFGTVADLLNLSNELHARDMVSTEDTSRFNHSSNSALDRFPHLLSPLHSLFVS